VVTRRALLAILATVALAGGARAQDASVQASVDRATIRDNESFTYTIRVDGAVRGEPDTAALDREFDVLARTSNSRIQILGGQTSQLTEWQFQLMPKAAGAQGAQAPARGELVVPPVRVGNLETKPIVLRVLPPEVASANAPSDIFMELDAQPSTIYAQAQVVVTLRLFLGVATGRATLTAPDVTGGEAIIEKLGEDAQYQTTRGGRAFTVRERRYAVFPQQAGSLTIGPATFEAMVIPDRGFSRVARFRSTTLGIDVQPAVPPPPTLAGAAWLPARRVTLSESWSGDADELTVGVPQTRRVVIEAEGLLETQLPELSLPEQTGIRQYEDQPELERAVGPQGLTSRRSVSMAVIAQTAGDVTLAGVRLPWWNVAEQRWDVAELPARTVRVLPNGDAAPAPAPAEPAAAPVEAPPPARSVWPLVSAALVVGWVATALLWWRSRRAVRAVRAAARAPARDAVARPPARKLLRVLDAACDAGNADAARRALLEWAESRFAPTPPRSLGALAAVLPQDVAREVLDLEAHLYGSTAGAWDGRALRATLPALEAAHGTADAGPDEPLLPLYR
jgi:oxygen tolerance protein BatD